MHKIYADFCRLRDLRDAGMEAPKYTEAQAFEKSITAHPAPSSDAPWKWGPGPDEFKAWCSTYFGPDSDENYLAGAIFNLPVMAQKFKWRATHPANGAQAGGSDD